MTRWGAGPAAHQRPLIRGARAGAPITGNWDHGHTNHSRGHCAAETAVLEACPSWADASSFGRSNWTERCSRPPCLPYTSAPGPRSSTERCYTEAWSGAAPTAWRSSSLCQIAPGRGYRTSPGYTEHNLGSFPTGIPDSHTVPVRHMTIRRHIAIRLLGACIPSRHGARHNSPVRAHCTNPSETAR